MAVDANTYAAVTDIQRLIGDIVDSRTFSGSTVPTSTQVENELDNTAAELNALLDMKGYTVKVSEADYPYAYNALKAANAYGSAARLLGTIPTEAYDPDQQMVDTGSSRPQMYERYFNQMRKQIENYKLSAGMRKNRMSRMKAGAATDSSGDDRDSLFKRGMLDYPGTTPYSENVE